jgi:glycosyltransferase involved in cell wall biosynthesis
MDSRQAVENPASQSARTDNPLEVSVVIPCLNEANSIGICVEKALRSIREANLSGEVLVADNGSTDGSIEISEKLGARVVRVSQRGYGAALNTGITASRGEFIVMGDADDSYDFLTVPQFVAKWREGYDVVMGNRFKGGIKPGAMPPLHKHLGNPGLTALMNMFFRTGVGDCLCGLRGFTRETFDRLDLRTTGMEWGPEFVIKASQLGVRMSEIPIILWPDKRGRPPHLKSFSDGWRNLRFMLLYAPNWLFLLPGAFLMLFGLALVFWLLPGPRHLGPRVIIDIHTMIFGVIFTLMGAQIVSIGFFAKVFSYALRFDRNPVSLKRMLRRIKLEHGLLLGAAMMLAGLIGDGWILAKWVQGDFGPLGLVRQTLFWSMWLFLGIQVLFSSFFLSMLGISRDTYIGDYERNR